MDNFNKFFTSFDNEAQSWVFNAECLTVMKAMIPSQSIDLIVADLPYGLTKHKDDVPIDPDLLWPEYWRVLKPDGIVILFGMDKFTAKMMLSTPYHRYNIIWDKVLSSNFLNANRRPLPCHEDIMVFYKKQGCYNPQKFKGKPNHGRGKVKITADNNYGNYNFVDNSKLLKDMKHPRSVLRFQRPHPSKAMHRTEKPLELLEWIIKTYSNENDWVLDNVAGSGVIGHACAVNCRNSILIEKDNGHFTNIVNRLKSLKTNNK